MLLQMNLGSANVTWTELNRTLRSSDAQHLGFITRVFVINNSIKQTHSYEANSSSPCEKIPHTSWKYAVRRCV
jgi:hypothetical protein